MANSATATCWKKLVILEYDFVDSERLKIDYVENDSYFLF